MIVRRPVGNGARRQPRRLLPALLGVGLVLSACAPRGQAFAPAPRSRAEATASTETTTSASAALTATAGAATTSSAAVSQAALTSATAERAALSTRSVVTIASVASVVSAAPPRAAPAAVTAPAEPSLGLVVPAGAGEAAAPARAPSEPASAERRPVAAPAAAAKPVPAAALPARASLGPLVDIEQTLNNCGPASVAEVLRYWGIARTQGQVQAVLRADGNPRGMEPYGVPAYARSLGLDALMGVNGDDAVVKSLVAAGFPVIVSQWVSATDHIAHYRPIEAYDDARGVFVASDPYLGPNHLIGYAEFDQIWRSGNGRFMVLYPPGQQAQLRAALAAAGWDSTAAYQADLAKLQRRAANEQDRFLAGNARWRSFGALSIAWDALQLGQLDAASAALRQAEAQQANAVLVRWIAQEIAAQQ